MYLPTRRSLHSIDPTLSDVMFQALREDATVELEKGDYGFKIIVDGVEMGDVASESFDYPLNRMNLSRDAETLAAEMVEKKHRRMIRKRIERLRTDDHSAAEGAETP